MTSAAKVLRTIDDLRASLDGPVMSAGDPASVGELAGINTSVRHDPILVIGAETTADVAAGVGWAARNGLPVAVHATGHSGTSYQGAVVVSTRRMNTVVVDPRGRTAWATAGAVWGQVIAAAAQYGLAPLNGSSPGVGVVGYTLGGGTGPIARTYGYAADHVRMMEVVTADGRIRMVDPTHDPDLFWALLGGKGNFGVVTAIEFDLHAVTRLYGGGLFWQGSAIAPVLHAYPSWTASLPEVTTTSVALLRLPDDPQVPERLRSTCTLHLRFAHLGAASQGARLLAPLQQVAEPTLDTMADMPYADIASIHNDPTTPSPHWTTGAYLRHLSRPAIDALLQSAGPDVDVPITVVELRQLGGALSRPPRFPNSVSGRNASFSLAVVARVPATVGAVPPQAATTVMRALTDWEAPETPLNLVHAPRDPSHPGTAWDDRTYRRLLEVKRVYDPDDRFRSGYSLLPT